ncbi:MAG TPA: enoyl-CoA hydratase/isomerase family protein [Desulfobacteraceae bacterium]|nr:enoyl-CoA hydratase/isomerase family protein [Deltaproteobacteria bacterium]MBW2355219.1 enoyl-CoA hydratase/isomerase family protein [Deltaproteobacteria bacterium]RLB97192.1 MAG: enoyl-CoA hydratase/isomerase family protein [Deltaproteobacteria bacterium]HDI60622.1 enoyl-CoA hydratase/isomerase family protein [Desulfobacteraceae bacterium]
MAYNNLIYEVSDGIATLTFNRPKALNALNRELLNEFTAALEQTAADEAVRVLVLTGAGDKAFVAGADITEIARCTPLQAKRFAALGQMAISRLQAMDIPVIAAVNGFALGGGTEMALACDFIYASEKARFGLPEITLGIIPGFGGTQRLPRLIGANAAKELIFTGRMIGAEEAARLGIVNRVCPPEGLMEAVLETARTIAAKGRVSLRAAKQAVNRGLDVDLATGCSLEVDAFALCLASPDAKEGTGAFLEKRQAVFSGGYED